MIMRATSVMLKFCSYFEILYKSRDVGVRVNDCLRLTNFHLLSDIAMTKKKLNISILVLKEILKQALFKLQMIDEPNCIESNFLHLPLDFVNQALNLIFSIISFHPALCQHQNEERTYCLRIIHSTKSKEYARVWSMISICYYSVQVHLQLNPILD